MRSVPAVLAACGCVLASGCKSKAPPPAPAAAAPAAVPVAVPVAPGPAVADRPAVLAELPAAPGDPAAPAPDAEFVFAERGGGVAYAAGAAGKLRVVHDGRAGPPYEAVWGIVLSPDGRRWGYAAQAGGATRAVVDGKEGPPFAELGPIVFGADGAHVVYAATQGGASHLVVDGTVGPGIPTRYRWYALGSGARIVFVEGPEDQEWGRLVVSDLALSKQTVVEPRASTVVLNAERSRLAAIVASGAGRTVLTASLDAPDRAARAPTYEVVNDPFFGPDGASVAFSGERGAERFVVLDGREERLGPGEDTYDWPVARPGGGVGAAVVGNGVVRVRQLLAGAPREEGPYDRAGAVAFSRDGRSWAYVAERGGRSFVVVNGREGPRLDAAVMPAFSPDGGSVVYRARQDGQRFVVIADLDAKTVRRLPSYEQVFPVQFTAGGRSIAYGVKDGRQLAWKVEPLPASR